MGKPYHPKDAFFKKAKKQGLRARSAFKLEEIVRRFALLKSGMRVLDLGSAPGGFLQIIAEAVGPKGHVLGVDLASIQKLPFPFVKTEVMDVLSETFDHQLASHQTGQWDSVISDLAPKTSGIKLTDEARSLRLATKALEITVRGARPGASFVAKLFMGEDFEPYRQRVRTYFEEVKVVRPEATRGASMEVYLVGLNLKIAATL